jgi:lysophospholipase L1-like esterase
MTLEDIEGNLASMAELAEAHKIKVIFSSVMPTCDTIRRQTDRRPNDKIIELNNWIKDYASSHHAGYIDYFNAMKDDKGELKQELTYDCLHPNSEGYDVMMPLAQKAIDKAVK